jgi:hypothetical protein
MSYLTNPFRYVAGGASWSTAIDNCILAGGTASLWTATNTAMKWNGTAWSNITALPADRQLLVGGGNFDNAIMISGDSGGTTTNEDDVYGWDGSSWNTLAPISIDNQMLCGGGNTTDAIWSSGTYSYVDTCQTFNGTSWSTVNSLTHGTRSAIGSGKSTDAFVMGGYTTTNLTFNQQFDGTNWADSTTCPSTTFYGTNCGAGLSGVQIVSNKIDSAGGVNTFDGSAFAETATTNYNRNSGMMGGDATNTMRAGGYPPKDDSETYDSSTWSTQGLLTTDIFASGFGGNTV